MKENKKIKAIIWDSWGVLVNAKCGSVAKVWSDLLGVPVEEIYKVFTGPELDQWHADDIGKLEFMNFVVNKLNLSQEQKKLLWYDVHDAYTYDETLVDYIKHLKERKFIQTMLTNVGRSSFEKIRYFSPELFEIFDYVIPSYKYRMVKPDPAIYKLALYLMDLNPEETCFIDDTPEFVESANKLGIQSILFKDSEQAISELESILSKEEIKIT